MTHLSPPTQTNPPPPKIAVIACAVLEDEVREFVEGLPHITSIVFLPQCLHNDPPRLNRVVSATVAAIEQNTIATLDFDAVLGPGALVGLDPKEKGSPLATCSARVLNPAPADAIVLVYGVCSRGIENIPLRRCRMIVPRAHDCITLLLGSKELYQEYQQKNPAIYWYSPGWNKCHAAPGPERFEKLRREFLRKFPEEEADYLVEMEKELHAHYTTAGYVDLGVGDRAANVEYTKKCACWMGWNYEQVAGDPKLLRDLLAGNWDDDRFLTVRPHQLVQLSIDDRVIKAVDEPQTPPPAQTPPARQRQL